MRWGVHGVWELLLQLQIVQNEAVAVVGYAEAVCGLAIGSSSEVGADPGGQPGARARTFQSPKCEPATLLQLSTYIVVIPFLRWATGDIFKPCADQCGTQEQLLTQEAERRSHRLLSPERNALRSASRTSHSLA